MRNVCRDPLQDHQTEHLSLAEEIADRAHRLHSHPNQYTEEEITLVEGTLTPV